jgi:hypothetical protein
MKLAALALVPLLAATTALAAPRHGGTTHGIANAALIAAAEAAPLKLIDALESYCDTDTTIADWLRGLTAGEASRIAWSAGECELVNSLNPNDEGGNYCVQATLTLKHPKEKGDTPELEFYLEDPKHGKPGEVYAFRAMFDSNEGGDYIRFRKDFESEWRDRFKNTPPPPCKDDE